MQSWFAPGRVELLGNHTDYNSGVVLSAALDLGVTVRGERLDGDVIELASEGFGPERVDFSGAVARRGDWTDYVVGVADALRRRGFAVGAFRAEFSSTLPRGAGLSSSAAMEVATAVMLRDLFDLDLSRMDVAKVSRQAENEFVGVQCGLLDQVSSVFGRAGHVVHLDCRDDSVRTIPFPGGVELLIINSGAVHELTGGEYNERREQCFEAASRMGVATLRDATPEMFAAADLPELVRRRAAHVIGEMERVRAADALLAVGDVEGVGRLLSASHRSSMENFENSTPELDQLVEIALLQEGVLGSRLTGGGFGGATVSLVRNDAVEAAERAILAEYAGATGIRADAVRCLIGDGALPED